ncbi:MAG TPA: ornithine cyclodeaminase family protein [Gemmataceae bacterium]|nr:ornithine cyclodeaminase family protein [Gemmataceae bacterium]
MASPSSLPANGSQGVLLLTEEDVRRLLTMDMALEAVEQGLRKLALDEAVNSPRARVQTDHAMLHIMAAAAKSMGVMGAKIYSTSRKSGARFILPLFDGKTGALLCLMQADYLGQMRTGAASGIATQYMARPDATEVGLFGSGKQARTQLQAICRVRRIRQVQVYSPHEERRRAFAAEMSEVCQTDVVPAARPEMAAEKKDIVITATTSREPVLTGHWIAEGAHINAIGSNFLGKAEIDGVTVRRCAVIAVDSKDQARLEAGDFQQALEDGSLRWADVRELGQIIVGRYPGRKHPQDVTLFKSLGIAIEDVAVAARVYARAQAEGAGQIIDW